MKTYFYGNAEQIRKRLSPHFIKIKLASKPYSTQDKPYTLASAGTWGVPGPRRCWDAAAGAIAAAFVCAVCCCR